VQALSRTRRKEASGTGGATDLARLVLRAPGSGACDRAPTKAAGARRRRAGQESARGLVWRVEARQRPRTRTVRAHGVGGAGPAASASAKGAVGNDGWAHIMSLTLVQAPPAGSSVSVARQQWWELHPLLPGRRQPLVLVVERQRGSPQRRCLQRQWQAAPEAACQERHPRHRQASVSGPGLVSTMEK